MNRSLSTRRAPRIVAWLVLPAVALGLALALAGDDKPAATPMQAKDLDGKPVDLAEGGPTLVLFLMGGQKRSEQAVAEVQPIAARHAGVRRIAVFNPGEGQKAAEQLKKSWGGPVLVDVDYALAGRLDVHVWPSTIVLKDGRTLAHLAGMPRTLEKDLEAYLAFASGRMTRDQLDQRLSHQTVVADDPAQMARRHLLAAERLMSKGLTGQAHDELQRGLKLNPKDVSLQLALARALLQMAQPQRAMAVLDAVDLSQVPPWRVDVIRGRALIGLKKWEQASAILTRAVRLNPEPAEAYYGLGLVYQEQANWAKAAEAYRAAFEATPAGRKLGLGQPQRTVPPADGQPASAPDQPDE